MSEYKPEIDWDASEFIVAWDAASKRANDIATKSGWHDPSKSVAESILLVHAELSEAVEALRIDDPESKQVPGRTEVEVELADAIIRIMDLAKAKGYSIGEAIVEKMSYNETRDRRHGNKIM